MLGAVPAGGNATLDRYIGYYRPYATSHADLDEDEGTQEEVRHVARSLVETVTAMRERRFTWPDGGPQQRPK